MKRSGGTLLAILLLALGANDPAAAQIPGLRDAVRAIGRVPSLSSFLEGDAPITTSLDDARTEVAFLDGYAPTVWEPMEELSRSAGGAFRLRPGRFALEAQSYCLHAGTYGPGGGDGYLYAPLAGPKAPIVRNILRNSIAHPEIPQRDVQVLLWAIIARTKLSDMPREMQRTAAQLLSRREISDLNGGALGLVPESVRQEAMGRLPPLVRQVFEAEARLRQMLTSAGATYEELERVAVLAGAAPPAEGSRPVPEGRWSYHPDGYFVRFDPHGYSHTRIEIAVPGPVTVSRDAKGRLTTVADGDGRRIEVMYDDAVPAADVAGDPGVRGHAVRSVRLATGAGTETVLEGRGWTLVGTPRGNGRPAAGGGRFGDLEGRYRTGLAWSEEWQALSAGGAGGGSGRRGAELSDLLDLGQLRLALEAAGAGSVAPGGAEAPWGAEGSAVAPADALDFLFEAWQSAFCAEAGCPSSAAGATGDVLVMRDGQVRRGELLGCAADRCFFAGSSVELGGVAWIGLEVGDESPPAIENEAIDETHLESHAVHPGNLVGISASRVVTDRDAFDRPRVAWIHLVPGEDETVPPPYGAPGEEPPADEPEDEPEEEEEEPQDEAQPEVDDGPTFDPSGDVGVPGNRGRQRLGQSGRSQGGGGTPPPADDRCAGERRALAQAEAMLQLHDDQMQSLVDRYNAKYDRLTRMNTEWQGMVDAASVQFEQFRQDALFNVAIMIMEEIVLGPLDAAGDVIGAMGDPGDVMAAYQFYTANTGTLAERRAWAQSENLNAVVRALDHLSSMLQMTASMTMLKHEYDEMEVNRENPERNVEDARRLLEACLARNG